MTKSLTEKWKDGTLPTGLYYIINLNGKEEIDHCFTIGEFWFNTDLKEVLAPVPSYDHFSQLVKKVKKLKKQMKEYEKCLMAIRDRGTEKDFDCILSADIVLQKWGIK